MVHAVTADISKRTPVNRNNDKALKIHNPKLSPFVRLHLLAFCLHRNPR